MTTNLPVHVDGSKTVKAMVARRPDGKNVSGLAAFGEMLKARRGSIAQVAASFLTPERVTKIALNAFSRNPALHDCTGESIFRSVLMAAELGLEPGGALGEAHLVPYGKECTLLVDYKGLEQLAYRSGQVISINAGCVYDGDEWEYEAGLEPKLRHIPGDTPRDPAKIRRAYCVVKLQNGGIIYDVMTRGEVDAIRARSRAGKSGPWVTDYAEMTKKTVLRRVLKHCPKSVEMQRALAADIAVDTGDFSEFDGDVVEAEVVETKASKVRQQLDAEPPIADPFGGPDPSQGPNWEDLDKQQQ